MFSKILIANRGDQLRSNLAAQPNRLSAHVMRSCKFDAETHNV